MGNSDTDNEHLAGTTWGVEGWDGHRMSPQQAQAHAIYEILETEMRLPGQLVNDTVVTGLRETQLKKALLVKGGKLVNNRTSFRTRASWGETTFKVVGPEVWNEKDDLTTLRGYLRNVKIIPKFVRLGSEIKLLGQGAEYDSQSVELTLRDDLG